MRSSVRTVADESKSTERALSPVLGIVLVVALTVLLAATLLAGLTTISLVSPAPTATFDLVADGDTNELTITHVSGDDIDVEALSVRIDIDGQELDQQPSVPFVGTSGFSGAPSGPLNANSDNTWRSGEQSTLEIGGNSPMPESGDDIRVTLSTDQGQIDSPETTAT